MSQAATFGTQTNYKFKFFDLDHKKIILEKSTSADSYEKALEKVSLECFRELRQKGTDGQDSIDICVNPHQG